MTQWIPKRLDIENWHGQRTTMDVGKDAVVTVLIKGPYVDLKLTDVKTLQMDCILEIQTTPGELR